MSLFMNNDRIGYQAVQYDSDNPDTYGSIVFDEVPEYLVEHELRVSLGQSLQDVVEGELNP